jgi:serpin B
MIRHASPGSGGIRHALPGSGGIRHALPGSGGPVREEGGISMGRMEIVLVAMGIMAAAPGADAPYKEAVEAGNRFSLDLYGRLSKGKGNLFLSPHSIHVALAMTCAGARGETAAEMAKVLRLPAGGSPHPSFAALLQKLNAGSREGKEELYRLVVANALWGQKGHPFRKEFLGLVRSSYSGALEEVDFGGAPEAARGRINSWVEEKTARKIRELIPPGALAPITRLVLTNAIYFKSGWMEPFPEDDTRSEPFLLAGGGKVPVPLMHQEEDFGYLQGEGFQAVEIPYRDRLLSMVVLLPSKGSDLSSLEGRLTAEALGRWIAYLRVRKVDLSFPRFKTTSQFSLDETLAAMGMPRAFSDKADLSGIDGTEELCIQAVLHKAFVAVDEEGTEAAAATGVSIGMKGEAEEEAAIVFRADRPFIYLIRHRPTGAILFLGRLVDPRE